MSSSNFLTHQGRKESINMQGSLRLFAMPSVAPAALAPKPHVSVRPEPQQNVLFLCVSKQKIPPLSASARPTASKQIRTRKCATFLQKHEVFKTLQQLENENKIDTSHIAGHSADVVDPCQPMPPHFDHAGISRHAGNAFLAQSGIHRSFPCQSCISQAK